MNDFLKGLILSVVVGGTIVMFLGALFSIGHCQEKKYLNSDGSGIYTYLPSICKAPIIIFNPAYHALKKLEPLYDYAVTPLQGERNE